MIRFSVKIIAEEVYDSFILEIRGRREQGNVTYPGKWVQIPKIAKTMTCDRFKGAAVVDKGIFNSIATFKRLFIFNLQFHKNYLLKGSYYTDCWELF